MMAPFDFETKKDRNRSYEQLRFRSCPLFDSSSFEFGGGRNDPPFCRRSSLTYSALTYFALEYGLSVSDLRGAV